MKLTVVPIQTRITKHLARPSGRVVVFVFVGRGQPNHTPGPWEQKRACQATMFRRNVRLPKVRRKNSSGNAVRAVVTHRESGATVVVTCRQGGPPSTVTPRPPGSGLWTLGVTLLLCDPPPQLVPPPPPCCLGPTWTRPMS